MSNEPRKDGLFHADGTRSTNFAGLHHVTPHEHCEKLQMKHKPHECPPIFHSDGRDVTRKFVEWATNLAAGQCGTMDHAIPYLTAGFASFNGSMNIAAHVSCAIREGSSEIAESLNRLARAIENSSPAAAPPTIVRLKDVSRRIGISSEAIMRLSRKNEFPQPTIRVAGVPFFREGDVTKWIADKAA